MYWNFNYCPCSFYSKVSNLYPDVDKAAKTALFPCCLTGSVVDQCPYLYFTRSPDLNYLPVPVPILFHKTSRNKLRKKVI